MRLLGINVARTTEGTITVEYHGEGNELVSVRMSADSALNDKEAVAFAEKMMDDLKVARGALRSGDSGEGASIDEMLAGEQPRKPSNP